MNKKEEILGRLFSSEERVLVAFSGGVDSTFLLYALKNYSRCKLGALTVKTPYIPEWEVQEAIEIAAELGIRHTLVELPFPEAVKHNPPDRCYRCKKILFSRIKEYAIAEGYTVVADGTNADDRGDYRPGMKALSELDIRSPLLEAGFTKSEIRSSLKSHGLKVWDKPAYACLLTRIPHDTEVNDDMLRVVEKAERYIHQLGFPGTRVRLHGEIARIEPPPSAIEQLADPHFRSQLVEHLKKLGIKYITLDLEGYRTGSLNLIKETAKK